MIQPFSPRALLFLIGCFLISATNALAQLCPPTTHYTHTTHEGNVETIHCDCDSGYENGGGACQRISDNRRSRKQIAALCESLDDEMQEMGAIDLKIVHLQVEALGKLLPVDIGIWQEAG